MTAAKRSLFFDTFYSLFYLFRHDCHPPIFHAVFAGGKGNQLIAKFRVRFDWI